MIIGNTATKYRGMVLLLLYVCMYVCMYTSLCIRDYFYKHEVKIVKHDYRK